MKRRQFLTSGTLGAAGLGTVGCAGLRRGPVIIKSDKIEAVPLKITKPKPVGSMSTGTIGNTDLTVSKFGFGGHMSQKLLSYTKEREFMIREAFDLGMTLFDVYEQNWQTMQMEPMGRYLEPIKHETQVSIVMMLYPEMNLVETFDEMRRRLRRDHIDMVRLHARTPDSPLFKHWDQLFKWRDEGKIRALGVAAHTPADLKWVVGNLPIDYVLMPYNFYHNLLWTGTTAGDMALEAEKLRANGIGVVVMKPLGTDWFIRPLMKAARKFEGGKDISVPQAAFRWVINSGLNPDATIAGMYSCDQLYENVAAYFNPDMSADERMLLEQLRTQTEVRATAWLPNHYQFLNQWATHDTPCMGRSRA